ncbi:glutathione S-transferase T3-like [Arachis stenosperma]|uniref:glutathione S-transferase T3-like n=1 Tax=Arachis stenosperma TaxID=217475 RepID=UPI0025AC44C0|nr:glutathione S-transferase T3-like [Arachis stenosperma]
MSNNLYCLSESGERRTLGVVVELGLEDVVDVSGLEVMLSKTWKWMLLVGEVQRRWMYQSQGFRMCVVHDMLRQFPIFQPQNQNSQTPHFPLSSIFNPSIGNVTPTSLPFPTQFSTSRRNSSGVGGSSNPSSQTPIQSSPNSQYSDFANPCGLDAIDLNDDDIEDRRQDSIQHWHWEEDEMLISAWLNVSTDPVVGTDQKGKTFWSRIHSYCIEFCSDITRGVVACKKRWYKINKAVAQFAGCYDQASRNIRSDSNADNIKELAYKLYSTNYGQKFTFERHWNMLRLEQKWRSQLPTQSGGSKKTKVMRTGAYSSSSNPETPLADEPVVDTPVRPQGSKKSKQKGKKKV